MRRRGPHVYSSGKASPQKRRDFRKGVSDPNRFPAPNTNVHHSLEFRGSRNIAKPLLWAALGLAGISVLIFTDLPLLYQPSAYRTKLIKDVVLLVPHVITGVLATILGPFLFSTRFRQRHLKRHRIMGRVYVIFIAISAPTALILQHDAHPSLFFAN